MNFIRHLRAAWLFTRAFPYVEEAETEDFWTPSDEQALRSFFNGYTGQKLKHRLGNYAIKKAISAAQSPTHSLHNSGIAAGIHMTIAAIDAHFPVGVPTDTESESTEAEAGFDRLEHTA